MRLIEEGVVFTVDRRSSICIVELLGTLNLISIKFHMAEVFNIVKLLFFEEHDHLMNQLFFDPNEQNTIAHHIFRNFEFLELLNRNCTTLLVRDQFSLLSIISVRRPIWRNENAFNILDLELLTFVIAELVIEVNNIGNYNKFTRRVLTNLEKVRKFLCFLLLGLRLLSSWGSGTFRRSCVGGSLLTKG